MTTSPAQVLLDLQQHDVEILRAYKRLEELPEKVAILEARAKIKEIAALHDKAATLERKLKAELKARQDEIATLTAKLDGEQQKVMQTTDHRQIQALTREMDGLKRRVDKLEMESLQYMERVEKASSQVATVDEHLAKLREREAALIKRYQTVGGAVQQEIATKSAERDALSTAVPADMLERYEKIRESRGGIGVGTLDGSSCTACHMSLPAERVKELSEGPDVGLCPQCRRLIVVRTESAE